MKRFRFTLEALQTLRQRTEEKALEEYGRALHSRRQAQEGCNASRKRMETAAAEHRGQTTSGMAAGNFIQFGNYWRGLEQQTKALELALQSANAITARSWDKWMAARQAREAVDKLHTHQHEIHRREEQKEEQKFLDDLAPRSELSLSQPPASDASAC